MEIFCWKERSYRPIKGGKQQQRANQEAASKAERGNGFKDIQSAEECCGHMLIQGEVYLLGRGRKDTIREQSRKRERTV
jgi:hypothetical protein